MHASLEAQRGNDNDVIQPPLAAITSQLDPYLERRQIARHPVVASKHASHTKTIQGSPHLGSAVQLGVTIENMPISAIAGHLSKSAIQVGFTCQPSCHANAIIFS